jgi:hypothetical protein
MSLVVLQVKEKLYRNRYLMDVFLPLPIEIFGCLHQQSENILYQCANMVWSTKDTTCPPLLVLCSFYKSRVSIALQRTHATTISKQAITIRESSSRLGILSGLRTLSLVDMLHAMQLVEGSIFSGSLSSPHGGLPLLGCLFAWTLVLVPLFLFLSLAWVLSFYKV